MPSSSALLFVALVAALQLLSASAVTYPTRDGIYCPTGMGQRRDIGELINAEPGQPVSDTAGLIVTEAVTMQYCKSSSYCFEISTKDVNVIRRNFGPTIDGVADWDAYYTEFYVKGCEFDFGTALYPTPEKPQRCPRDKSGKPLAGGTSSWIVEHNKTLAALQGVEASQFTFTLEYCCYNHYCNAAGRAGVAMGVLAVVAALTALATDLFV